MLELEFYCQIQGLEYQIFDSNQEYYVHIKGDNADSDVVRYLILQQYPDAVAVSVTPNVSVIYRVGTVFDMIKHSDKKPTLSFLRSVMPNLIANDIVSVQPMASPALIHTLARSYDRNKDSE